MKIYTRTGDNGTTALFGGDRVRKSDQRLECCGTIDELNAALGVAAVGADEGIAQRVHRVQNELFTIGAHLATPPSSPAGTHLPPLDESMVQRLEMEIDAGETELPALRQFILPGGSEIAARLHVARTVCRRAERLLVCLAMERPLVPLLMAYINRLSDWLFVMARLANRRSGVTDVPWVK